MSGYPGAPPSAYPGAPGAPPAGYPGAPGGGYPGAPGGGYPGASGGGYPGAPGAPGGGYPGAPGGGYPGASGAPGGGYPGGGYQGGEFQSAPQVDPQVQQWFNAVDTDRSGQIDAQELQRALVNGNWSKFSMEACRMMIDMFDNDKTGQISVQEFGSLYSFINQWKATFEALDADKSGVIDAGEFTQALEQMGYRFSPTFINNILIKYNPKERRLTLDNFIVATVQIKRLTDSFRARDTQMQGQATLVYEDFVGLAMGAHK
ncbi:peflin isoform X2 [Eurytemora carolleeae]|uniref:peflin isoform X2 n=1 Tax=Eurytemora carolleeae TaxID=1294199 RepID=UPI000C76E8AA|nr:peflin isoform X2 [Eurytemora carolleeae]|eukprot:XP_023323282.1 peflin-like isoform X2 [Eurytemora affinis]